MRLQWNHAGIDDVMDALGHRDPTSVMKYLFMEDERSRKCGLSLDSAGIPWRSGMKIRNMKGSDPGKKLQLKKYCTSVKKIIYQS